MKLLRRLRFLLHQRELAEEMRVHQEMRRADGLPEAGFGSELVLRERSREAWGWMWLSSLKRDLRYALRLLRRAPGFASVAVLSLAIGMGAMVAVYSMAEAFYSRLLPLANSGQLFTLYWASLHWQPPGYSDTAEYRDAHERVVSVFSYPLWRQWRRDVAPLANLAGFQHLPAIDVGTGGGPAERVRGALVSGNFDRTVGIVPTFGRGISAADNQPGAPLVAELSYAFWKSHLGGERAVLGRTISIDGLPATIVGVGPRAFTGLEPLYHPAIFVPLAAMAGPLGARAKLHQPQLGDAGEWWVQTIGCLRPGATRAQVKAALAVDFARTVAAMPHDASSGGEKPELLAVSAANGISANLQALALMVEILGWLAALVLLIAVANLANLLLARRAARRPELGLRMAIGAGPGAIARQVATESLLLAAMGGVAAVPAAALAQHALQSLVPAPIRLGLGFDARVLGFTLLVALATGIVLTLIHIWRLPASLQPALHEAAAGGAGPRIGKLLLGVQVAFCLVVLAGAGLFLRTLQNLESVNTGVDSQHILLFGVAPGMEGFNSAQRGAFYAALLARLRSLPGVVSASAVSDPPGSPARDIAGDITLSPATPRGNNPSTALETISSGFFATYRLPLVAGRDFTASDDATAPAVAIVNQKMGKRFHRDPVGRKLYWGARTLTIVGVAANAAYDGLEGGAVPILYTPLAQGLERTPGTGFAVRSRLPEAALARVIRSTVATLAPSVPVTSLETQQQAMAASYVPQRVLALACTGLGLVALLLAAVGLYGLMSYALARRTREIGIRMALGASGPSVARMLAGELLWVVGAGAAAGMALTLAAGKLFASLLFRLSPRDPLTLAGTAIFLFLVAAAAAALPARRAARLDPAITLRNE